MKKLMKKLLGLTLAAVTVFSVAACSDGGDGGGDENKDPNGVHDIIAEETDHYLLQNGQTQYKIVVPEETSLEINTARNELVTLFKEATGATLQVITDEGLAHSATNKYISLGKTALYTSAGIESKVDAATLKRDGVRILTKDQTIFFLGGTSDYGVLYGVYDFLNLHFGFETYFKDTYALKTGVRDLKLYSYDITDIPDIEFRSRAIGAQYESTTAYNDKMYSYRTRTRDHFQNFLLPVGGYIEHNSIRGYFPHEEYDSSEYASDIYGGQQLCYTGHGKKEVYDFMVDEAAKKIEASLMRYTPESYPDMNAVQLGTEDNNQMCPCNACKAVQEKYNNSIAATIIIFLKDVARKVNAWMEEEENAAYKREGFQYMFFAYWGTERAPVTYNEETGTYDAPVDNAILPEGLNVVPFVAVKNLDHGKPLTADKNRIAYLEYMAWTSLYPGSWMWTYGHSYNDYWFFADIYAFYSEILPTMAENEVKFSFIQIHNHQRGSDTGFNNLAAYIIGKLQWNSSLNVGKLIESYFEGMYQNAAPAMKEYFKLCQLWFADNFRDAQVWDQRTDVIVSYFNVGTLNTMFTKLDEAYEAIKIYERDEATYNRIKLNIDTEWLFPAKIAVGGSFTEYFTTSSMAAMKTKFKEACASLGMVALTETNHDLASFLNSL